MRSRSRLLAVLALSGLAACGTDSAVPGDTDPALVDPASVAVDPGPPVTRRLTNAQYVRAVHGLFGTDVTVPAEIEPELRVDGQKAVGAGVTVISPRGVERYEQAAFDIAEQALDPARRDRWLPCDLTAADCPRTALEQVGLRAWRRPLTEAELDALTGLVDAARAALGDPAEAMQFGLAGILQSPWFLMRPEIGVDPAAGATDLTAWELATRLSFLLWDAPPDQPLLDAAADGSLLTPDGLDAQAIRMLDDPRARDGVRAWFADWFALDQLDSLEKDPALFIHMSDRVGPAAREETLRTVEDIVFEQDTDLRTMYTTRRTFIDRTLAAIYGVKAPARDGFAEATFPEGSDRAGILGQVAYLANHSHSTSTSPTLRGAFLRESLLCQVVPDPPAGVNTAIPEASEEAPTLRDRVEAHMNVEGCAACHTLFDPMGLAMERFDGLGVYRETENGAPIDASGELDGVPVTGLTELARAMSEHPAVPTCTVEQLARRALGRRPTEAEDPAVDALVQAYAARGYRLKPLLLDLVQTQAFRRVDPTKAVEPTPEASSEAGGAE